MSANKGSWLVVHPGTGTIISLSDEVYVVNMKDIKPLPEPDDEMGIVEAALTFGYRFDNHAAHMMYDVEPYESLD